MPKLLLKDHGYVFVVDPRVPGGEYRPGSNPPEIHGSLFPLLWTGPARELPDGRYDQAVRALLPLDAQASMMAESHRRSAILCHPTVAKSTKGARSAPGPDPAGNRSADARTTGARIGRVGHATARLMYRWPGDWYVPDAAPPGRAGPAQGSARHLTPLPTPSTKAHQWSWPRRPRVSSGVAPGRVHCGTGRLVGPQVAFPSASERQYQHGWRPSGQPSGLASHASPRP